MHHGMHYGRATVGISLLPLAFSKLLSCLLQLWPGHSHVPVKVLDWCSHEPLCIHFCLGKEVLQHDKASCLNAKIFERGGLSLLEASSTIWFQMMAYCQTNIQAQQWLTYYLIPCCLHCLVQFLSGLLVTH